MYSSPRAPFLGAMPTTLLNPLFLHVVPLNSDIQASFDVYDE